MAIRFVHVAFAAAIVVVALLFGASVVFVFRTGQVGTPF